MNEIAIIMGSKSDWNVMKEACLLLEEFEVPYSRDIVSAHRTPERMYDYAKHAESTKIKVIIAGAGGAAHLPGMIAALTTIPVIGVPIKSSKLNGIDSLLSIVQMPGGIPVATMGLDKAGFTNACLFAQQILALEDGSKKANLVAERKLMVEKIRSVRSADSGG